MPYFCKMGNILRITTKASQRLFEKHIDIGVCHEFKGGQTKEGCNCPKDEKPKPFHVLTISACQ